jgi:SAM-dependent methyltransferase
LARAAGQIHRKDWEWAMGILAMRRLGKLDKSSTVLGIGAGKELVLFYLANHVGQVHATDLYEAEAWQNFAPSDFPVNPAKYAPFPYDERALAVSRMDATRLAFRSDSFDLVFSFSSIEHFGGENHSGALSSMKEVERVLKPGGIAVIATEYIINDKEAPDLANQFYNRRTIYSDLIDKLETMHLVEPLDLMVTAKTLDTVMDVRDAEKWDKSVFDDGYKKMHPYILLRTGNILLTSVMLVFQKS